jgi:hypothetical protein
MKSNEAKHNPSTTCQKLDGAYSGLETTADSLIERIGILSTKINEYFLNEDSIQVTNKIN